MSKGKLTIVNGGFFGDEGKGKITDYYASNWADYVIRFSGGNNAGHTIIDDEGNKYVLHILPSGLVNSHVIGVLGASTYINPVVLEEDISEIAKGGFTVTTDNLIIDSRANIILQSHMDLDEAQEQSLGDKKIGTTKKGIGLVAQDLFGRRTIRFCDCTHDETLEARIKDLIEHHNILRKHYGLELLDVDGVKAEVKQKTKRFMPFVKDNVWQIVNGAYNDGKKILAEGAQGFMLDVTWGEQPNVTSSFVGKAGFEQSSGLCVEPYKNIAVVKLLASKVGSGYFVTELEDEIDAKRLRDKAGEYGATTGRPRRIGYLDLVSLKETSIRNGCTEIALTKVDVFDGEKEINLCVGYKNANGDVIDYMPANPIDLKSLTPIYITFPVWSGSVASMDEIDQLPAEVMAIKDCIESFVGLPVSHITTGPERKATVNFEV